MQTGKLAIGCSIHGVDAKSLAPGQMLKIKDLLYKNRLIVLKDQSLTEQEYCDFAHRVGSPVPYLQDNYHHPEFPLIFVSSSGCLRLRCFFRLWRFLFFLIGL